MNRRAGISAGGVAAALVVAAAACVAVYFALGGWEPLRKEIAPPDESLRFRKTDPALVAYVQVGQVATGMKEPAGIAVGKDGRLYVAGDSRVRLFDANGKMESEFSTAGPPSCVAIGPDGRIYVGAGNRVEVYDANGRRQGVWDRLDPNAMISSIAVGPRDVFLADDFSSAVLRCDLAGNVIGRIGRPDANRDVPGILLRSPHFDVTIGPDGLLWVANPGRHLVESYTFAGEPKSSWGELSAEMPGFSGCCNPKDIAFGPDGMIVTGEKGFPRVKVYDPHGRFLSVVAGTESFDDSAKYLDLAVDGRGRVFVLDALVSIVRVFERKKP